MANRRWHEPSTVDGRKEFRKLRRELRKAGSKKRRDELIAQFDSLYGRGTPVGKREPSQPTGESVIPDTARPEARQRILSGKREPKSSLRLRTEKESNKAEARRAAESDGVLAPRTPAEVEAYIQRMSARLEEEKFSDPIKRRRIAAHHLGVVTDCPLRRRANQYDNPSSVIWENILLHENKTPNPGVKPEWVEELLNEADRRFAEDENWLRRAFADGTAFKSDVQVTVPTTPEAQKAPVPAIPRVNRADEPATTLDPLAAASADLARRSELILRSDAWLTRLSGHSPQLREQTMAALSTELLRVGCVSGDFCARTYNTLRPRALSAFPERRF